jgi:hypothetical protein
MGRPRQEIRVIDGVRHKWCAHHKTWQELGEFDLKNASGTHEASCRVGRMAQRDRRKVGEESPEYWGTDTGIDPDLHLIAQRFVERGADEVVRRARFAGETINRKFVMSELNYISLIPQVRALIGPDGSCSWCGVPFTAKHRISLDHVEPPRWDGGIDWERLHTQNIQPMHVGENGAKSDKPFAVALHDNMQRWMAERRWARHAGEPGWPSLRSMGLPPPAPIQTLDELLAVPERTYYQLSLLEDA